MAVQPARFEEQLEVLAAKFRPIRVAELADAVRRDELPAGAVALTFDDGYRDNLENAKPLLEGFGVPATVFVVTAYVDSGRDFWWDVLERISESESEYRARHRELQALTHEERQAWLEAVAPPGEGEISSLTRGELRRLADGDLIDIGAHSVTHPDLTRLTRGEQLDELRRSKEQLASWLDREIEGCSYPFGAYGPETVACARDASFAYACTSAGRAVMADDVPYELPRLHVDDWPGDELERRLVEALD